MSRITQPSKLKDSLLGEIPEDWEALPIDIRLKQIIDYRGKTPEKTDSGIPLITAKNVRDGYLDIEPREYIRERDYDAWMRRGIPSPGDILFTTEAPLGNVAKVPDYKIALAQRLLTLIPSPDELDANYLFWVLQWAESRRRLEQKSTGSTVLGIKQSVFRQFLFRFPPLEQQQKIAKILDSIDSTIAQTSALIAKLKQMKAGLLHDLLTRGLDENGELRDAIAHPEHFKPSPLGQIPKEWEVIRIGDVTTVENGTTPARDQPRFWQDGSFPWLTTGKVHDRFICHADEFVTELAMRVCSLRLLPVGSILVAMIGQGLTRGKVAYLATEASINQNFGAILPCSEFNSRFLFHYLDFNYEYVRGSSRGSNQQALNCSVVAKLSIVRPPLQEQNAITKAIDAYDLRIQREKAYLTKLQEQKKGLMHDLLTGRVRVTDLQEIPA